MNAIINLLKLTGYKTYIAGIGMICLGIYQITQGEFDSGMKTIAEGLAVFGVRAAIEKVQ